MKSFLEIKNRLKEMIKGTSLEPMAKSILNVATKTGQDDFNTQDNAWTNEIMYRVLTPSSNCIDVGCNTGDFLITIQKIATSGYHYAFEPIPRLANRLKKRFPNVDTREIALSDSEGEATFWYAVNSPATSSLDKQVCEERTSNAVVEPITVKTQTLDNILPSDFKVDLIKVDVEGVEFQVFKGATRTLKTYKPYVIFEHGKSNFDEQHEDGLHDRRIYDLFVSECGLKIYDLKSWLEGSSALSLNEFTTSPRWNFLAAP